MAWSGHIELMEIDANRILEIRNGIKQSIE